MADPFRQLFLEQIRLILEKDPSKESMHEMLKMASPYLTEADVMVSATREKAFKTLQLRIHPDKHADKDTATQVFQDVQTFYDRCCQSLSSARPRKKKSASPTSAKDFPQEFHVEDQWSFLHMSSLEPVVNTSSFNQKELPLLIAARCMNARGAIAHGKTTGLNYSIDQLRTHVCATVEDAFAYVGGGTKRLHDVDEIKEELRKNGPVVSTSFTLDRGVAAAGECENTFAHQRIGKTHELLIVGWKLTAFGEVWLAKPLYSGPTVNENPIRIAFGQFDIDEECLAPKASFENTPWEAGPYFDHELSRVPEWRTWHGVEMRITSLDLEKLAGCFDEGFYSAILNKKRFVIRDEAKFAHSRAAYLTEVTWNKAEKKWKVSASFID